MGYDDRIFWQMIHAKNENKDLTSVIEQMRAENKQLKTEIEQLKKRVWNLSLKRKKVADI